MLRPDLQPIRGSTACDGPWRPTIARRCVGADGELTSAAPRRLLVARRDLEAVGEPCVPRSDASPAMPEQVADQRVVRAPGLRRGRRRNLPAPGDGIGD